MNKYVYIYGHHAATHALCNEDRNIKEIFITKNAYKKIVENNNIEIQKFNTKIVESKTINDMLDGNQVHQGILIVSEKKKSLRLMIMIFRILNELYFLIM